MRLVGPELRGVLCESWPLGWETAFSGKCFKRAEKKNLKGDWVALKRRGVEMAVSPPLLKPYLRPASVFGWVMN